MAVVGSGNLDVVMAVERFPAPGETVLGTRYQEAAGGKGTNQAMAAARAATAAFVGCLGDDAAGTTVQEALDEAGVDSRFVDRRSEPTGRAFVQVAPDGENSIVVMPLANAALAGDLVAAALGILQPAVVLAQLEIPASAVEAAVDWCRGSGARFLLNPSPVRDLSPVLLSRCDPLVLNVREGQALLRASAVASPEDPEDLDVTELTRLLGELSSSVVVTDGSRGACIGSRQGGVTRVEGTSVTAVDTTGAGDEFAGALAAALANGLRLERAAELANEAAARLVRLPRDRRA